MKTIEERVAEIFADRFCTLCPKILYTTCDRKLPGCCRIPEVRCMHEVIMNTIVSERKNLTRWNDPKEVLPENCPHLLMDQFATKKVLVKLSDGGYVIAIRYNSVPDGWGWSVCSSSWRNIIGWREIHE